MASVDIDDAAHQLADPIARAADGERVVLTRDGKPVAEIVPIRRVGKRREFGSARGMIKMRPGFDDPLEEMREYT